MKFAKRLISVIMCVLLVVMVIPMDVVVAKEIDVEILDSSPFAGGDGSSENPYVISTANQLNCVRDYLDKSFILSSNIDLSSFDNWTPIGSISAPFTGVFDGNGYVISNVIIDNRIKTLDFVDDMGETGFFRYAKNAMIKNLGIEDAKYTITSEDFTSKTFSNAGGFVSRIENTAIEKCYFEGSISNNVGKNVFSRVGGIVAGGVDSNVNNCYCNASLYANAYNMNTMVAGITPWLDGTSIDKCYVAGSVIGENTTGYSYVGGFNASGNASVSWGIITSYGGTVKNSVYLLDTLTANGVENVIDNIGSYSSHSNNLILASDSKEAFDKSTYESLGWDFESVWSINEGYPVLIQNNALGFSPMRDGWSFVNYYEGFNYPDDGSYYIPFERYASVFGGEYVAAAAARGEGFTSMIDPDWGGNCYGMSVTAILFYLRKLDWSVYDALYENDFSTVNSYYYTQRYFGNVVHRKAYACSDMNTPVTELIEKYQILLYNDNQGYRFGKNSTYSMVEDNYRIFTGNTESDNKPTYRHNEEGNYIDTIYKKFINTSEPLIVEIQGNGAHAMVLRTDKKPVDCGDGWYKFYVYDPNYPYMSNMEGIKYTLREYYLNNYEDETYIELNPSENKWRYKGATNAGEASYYWGCDENGLVLMHGNCPNWMFVYSLSDIEYPTVFNGTEPWKSKYLEDGTETSTVSSTGNSTFDIVSNTGEKLVSVTDGVPYIYDNSIEYVSYVGTMYYGQRYCGGRIVLPYTDYRIDYVKGDDITVIGTDSVINIACTNKAKIKVSTKGNELEIASGYCNDILAQISDVSLENGYTSVCVDGTLEAEDSIVLSLNNDKLIVEDNIKSESNVDIYTDNDMHSEERYVTTLDISIDDGVEIFDVRSIDDNTQVPTTSPSEREEDKDITCLVGDSNGDGKVNVKDATEIQKAVAGLLTLDDIEELAADVDVSGKVNVKDATAIQKYLAGMKVDYPIGEQMSFGDLNGGSKDEYVCDKVVFDRQYHDSNEYAIISAYDESGDLIWKYTTPEYGRTQLDRTSEIGLNKGRYYFVQDRAVVALDASTGDVLWINDDFGGSGTDVAFGEDAIYLCGYLGPDFYAVSFDGETLGRIDCIDDAYFWAQKIDVDDSRATVYMYGGPDGYLKTPKEFHIDLSSYEVVL